MEDIPIPVRATRLSMNQQPDPVVLLHPCADLLNIDAFCDREGTQFDLVPASHANGVPLEELPNDGSLLLDHALLNKGALKVWRQEGDNYEEVSASDFSGGMVVQASEPLRRAIGAGQPDRERINDAVSTFTERRIQQRLDETLDIPPLPEAARRIVALQADPDYDLGDLVNVVETDPAIAAKVMSWANSAFYAPDPPARDLNDAIMRVLGFDLVINLAMGLVLSGTLNLPKSHVRGAPPVWLQAVYTATAMEALARRLSARTDESPSPGSCYLTGLLANFGTLVVGHVFPPQFAQICALEEANPQLPQAQIDEHVIQLPREILAATLLEQWELPDEVVAAIRHQGTDNYRGDYASWVMLLQCANTIVTSAKRDPENWAPLSLTPEDVAAVTEQIEDSQEQLETLSRAIAG